MIPAGIEALAPILFPVGLLMLYRDQRFEIDSLNRVARAVVNVLSVSNANTTLLLRLYTVGFIMFVTGDLAFTYRCASKILETIIGRDRLRLYVQNVSSLINQHIESHPPDRVALWRSYLHFMFVAFYMLLLIPALIRGLHNIGIIVHPDKIHPMVYVIISTVVFTGENYKLLFSFVYAFLMLELLIPLVFSKASPSVTTYIENIVKEYNWGVIHIP